jgi:integrase
MTKIIQMPFTFVTNEKQNNNDEITLKEAYFDYINSKSSILSPSTIRNYYVYQRNSFPELMGLDLSELDNIKIQIAVNRYALNHSPKTVRNAFSLLHSVISTYRPDLSSVNITLPQKIKPKYLIPTTEEITKLLTQADDKIRLPILLACQGGLRRSEIAALTPDDFNFLGVTVNKAVVYDLNYNAVIKTTKTVSSDRFVPLPHTVIKEANRYQYFGLTPSEISKSYDKLILQCNVPHFSFHKLRHYFASELHAHKIPERYIAKVGGWSSLSVLQNIYEHTLRDKQEEFEEQITKVFTENFG